MELGKADIAMLSRFFRDEDQLVLKASAKLHRWLTQHFDLYHNGKGFVFKPDTKLKLRAEIESLYPRLNAREGLPTGLERLAVVEYVNNDKLADIKPNDHYVLVTSQTGLELAEQAFLLPAGISLRVPLRAIPLDSLTNLIIVENQDVFDNWHSVSLDSAYQNSLVVYRGHEKGLSRGLISLLSLVSANTQVLLCADLDPKGLEMAYTTSRVDGILAPQLTDMQQRLIEYSQHEVYLRQRDSVTFLTKQQPAGWRPLQDFIVSRHLAIMQQVYVALGLKLVVFQRHLNNPSCITNQQQ